MVLISSAIMLLNLQLNTFTDVQQSNLTETLMDAHATANYAGTVRNKL